MLYIYALLCLSVTFLFACVAFPHVWDGVGVESKIESVGEVCETEWPNVLKVSDANVIRSCGVVVFAVPDGS